MAITLESDLSDLVPDYRFREGQADLSRAVENAISKGNVLFAEAGTGTGKTLAYLLPLLKYAADAEVRVAVSTETRSLQHQLTSRDIPLAEKILGIDARSEICLGASNYLCKRKLADVSQQGTFAMAGSMDEFLAWESFTSTGIRSEYQGPLPDSFWNLVGRESDNCLGKRCSNYNESYYFVAREKWKNARLLILNHALLASHLMLDGRLLPEFDVVVIDEGHRFPGAVRDARTVNVSLSDLSVWLRSARFHSERLTHHLEKVSFEIDKEIGYSSGRVKSGLKAPSLISFADGVQSVVADLNQRLDNRDGDSGDPEDLKERMLLNRLAQAVELLVAFSEGEKPGNVLWISGDQIRGKRNLTLHKSPMDSGEFIREEFLGKYHSVICTSATLTSAAADPFHYFASEMGALRSDRLQTKQIDSPFDYEKRTLLYLPDGISDPGVEDDFYQDVARHIRDLVNLTSGGAFVLFTSRQGLRQTKMILSEIDPDRNYISQIEDGPAGALRRYHSETDPVLLGLASFWQGIDVPGDSLRLVIIVKLPFQTPDDPVLSARVERMQAQGENPFMKIQLPQSILTLKQGFGRLMRREADRGVVAILDPRLRSRKYGASILKCLPRAKVSHDLQELTDRYRALFDDVPDSTDIS